MSVLKEFDRFGTEITKRARQNLKRKGKSASGSLAKSMHHEITQHKNSFSFVWLMEDYGKFVDKGVKGVGGTKADGTKWKKKRVTNNLYKYRDKRPPALKAFGSWVIRKGIAPRSKGGQFTSRKGLLFALSESVYHTGLETTNFFTKAFDAAFKGFPDKIIKVFSIEVEEVLQDIVKK